MKVCPTCQSSYPDGFKYCPQDNTTLMTGEDYARQSQSAPNLAPVISTPEISSITPKSRVTEDKISTPAEAPNVPPYIAPREVEYGSSASTVTVPSSAKSDEPAKSTAEKNNKAAAAPVNNFSNGTAAATGDNSFSGGLNLALPESGNLFSRLFGALGNIKDVKFTFNPNQWLIVRALRELVQTFVEFSRDPKKFVSDIVRGEGANSRRLVMMLAGSEMAFVGYLSLYLCFQAVLLLGKQKPMTFNLLCLLFATYLVGCFIARGFIWRKILGIFTPPSEANDEGRKLLPGAASLATTAGSPQQNLPNTRIVTSASKALVAFPKVGVDFATWLPVLGLLLFVWFSPRWFCEVFPGRCFVETAKEDEYKLIAPNVTAEKPPEVKKVAEKVPKAMEGKGGFTGGSKPKPQQAQGGGGQQNNAPVSKGVPPQMTNIPQVMPPTLRPPTVKNATLVVPPTLVGDDKLSKAMPGRIGLPDGADAPPSLGNGSGTGLGSGRGGGRGPGEGGNMGGGKNQTGGGDGDGGSGGIQQATATMKPTILYREKAKYTEAARQNRVQGTVLLSAVFTADGRVTSIKVLRGLPDGLNEEAIKAAQKIKFNPAMKNGQAQSVRMSMEFTFNLL